MSATANQPTSPADVADEPNGPSGEQLVQSFIDHRINFERLSIDRYDIEDFKLNRMRTLLRRLGDPQQSLPCVHVAGTKGKGSTAAMTAAMLAAAGYRVGLFTSPHLESIGERMTINGRMPTDQQYRELLKIVPPVVEEMDRLGHTMRATFFECITAFAWIHFVREKVDVVVLEVGLGGRLDATNVCAPLVTVITSISRDHERLLGSTLAEIAAEKAGIIKPKIPVISGVVQPEPRRVIQRAAANHDAPLHELERDLHWIEIPTDPVDRDASRPFPPLTIDAHTPWKSHRVRVPLPGRHQANNTLLALAACDLLNARGFGVDERAIQHGLESLQWPLRIEVLSERPLVIVDAAHNDGSIDSLVATLSTAPRSRRTLIFATSKDKDTAGMLRRLNPHFDRVVLTKFQGNPRAVPLDALQEIAADSLTIPFEVAETPAEAWRRVRDTATDNDLICTAGSFFLAAEMRSVILSETGKPAASVCC